MPVHVSRLSGLLRLLALCLVLFLPAGCAGTQQSDASLPRLPSVSLPEGSSVHVAVTGQDPPASDMASLVSAYLQSECSLRIADSPRDADAVVREELDAYNERLFEATGERNSEHSCWQYFAVLPDIRSVGVMGDERGMVATSVFGFLLDENSLVGI